MAFFSLKTILIFCSAPRATASVRPPWYLLPHLGQLVYHPSARAGVDDCPPARRWTANPPLLRYLPVPCLGEFRDGRALLAHPISLCQRVLLLCMAREEERGQESDGREAGENETKDKLSVLIFIPSVPRPS